MHGIKIMKTSEGVYIDNLLGIEEPEVGRVVVFEEGATEQVWAAARVEVLGAGPNMVVRTWVRRPVLQ